MTKPASSSVKKFLVGWLISYAAFLILLGVTGVDNFARAAGNAMVSTLVAALIVLGIDKFVKRLSLLVFVVLTLVLVFLLRALTVLQQAGSSY